VNPELSILMPCLDEAETLAICLQKAKRFISDSGVAGEVVVADNGSTDGSLQIAEQAGAVVVTVALKGYGAALLGGIRAARGRYIIMGDADDSYDFSSLTPFLHCLRAGADVVIGNRFKGGVAPDAMPALHRYVGNPLLSAIGRLFFHTHIRDFHCGLRGFNRDRLIALNLQTTGMEFASEMIVRAALSGYHIEEVPTTLKKDGRSRRPHLSTWRDGLRQLIFLLMYSPRWLFLYPGIALLVLGLFGAFVLLPGPLKVGPVEFDIHTFIVACVSILVGVQAISFAVIVRRFAAAHRLLPRSQRFSDILDSVTLERVLLGAAVITLAGFAGLIWCIFQWASTKFGPLEYSTILRTLVISLTAIAIGMQLMWTGFVAAIMDIPTR
jgi:Glycosyl transferase family 2